MGHYQFKELENRTTLFGQSIIQYCKSIVFTPISSPIITQVIRSSGSIGANYREANETTTNKDRLYRMRIARKEAKETDHWLSLLLTLEPKRDDEIRTLKAELTQLRKILTVIINKLS